MFWMQSSIDTPTDICGADETREFVRVYSKPVAQIDRLRYLLLLSKEKPTSIFAPKANNKASKKTPENKNTKKIGTQ